MNDAANRGKRLMMASPPYHGVRQNLDMLGHCVCVCVVGIAWLRLRYLFWWPNWAALLHQAPYFLLQFRLEWLESVGQLETLPEACQSTQNKTIGKGTVLNLQLFCRFWTWCILYEMHTDVNSSSKSSPCMSWRCCCPVGATKQMWIDQRRGTKNLAGMCEHRISISLVTQIQGIWSVDIILGRFWWFWNILDRYYGEIEMIWNICPYIKLISIVLDIFQYMSIVSKGTAVHFDVDISLRAPRSGTWAGMCWSHTSSMEAPCVISHGFFTVHVMVYS